MEPLGTGTLVFLVIYPWIFLHYNPVPTDTIYPILLVHSPVLSIEYPKYSGYTGRGTL